MSDRTSDRDPGGMSRPPASRRPGTDPAGLAAAFALGAAGAAAAAVAGGGWAVAVPAGAGIAALVWLVSTGTSRLTGSRPGPGPGHRPAAPAGRPRDPVPQDALAWLYRATVAADRLTGHAAEVPALSEAAAYVQGAVERLHDQGQAVAVIDAEAGGPDSRALRRDQRRLAEQAAALPPGPLRSAKEASARATAERAEARSRLEELRELLLATLESTTLRMEAAADRGSVLVSLQAAGEDAAGRLDRDPLGDELEAVRAGLDKLEEITHGLLDGGGPP
ncbi:hypothetical protein [Streptomyces aidingensis]|uniref:Uncharacterized protein n=1 Tax=Streptomyces aidingensis TaxID=910347 RepID=A0A1I1FBZ9_9ACTN|nr:hypothetical protein [Streptomyces aidingensis]SFB96927.1 hypothetical protein SAMN05421773_101677 [Streptomyces aidingensis]